MPIRDWPPEERPREKLLARGAAAMSDAELLAIFLRTGVKGKTAVDLARDMLSDFGGLRALLEADVKTFCRTKGLGTANPFLSMAAKPTCDRVAAFERKRPPNPAAARAGVV